MIKYAMFFELPTPGNADHEEYVFTGREPSIEIPGKGEFFLASTSDADRQVEPSNSFKSTGATLLLLNRDMYKRLREHHLASKGKPTYFETGSKLARFIPSTGGFQIDFLFNTPEVTPDEILAAMASSSDHSPIWGMFREVFRDQIMTHAYEMVQKEAQASNLKLFTVAVNFVGIDNYSPVALKVVQKILHGFQFKTAPKDSASPHRFSIPLESLTGNSA